MHAKMKLILLGGFLGSGKTTGIVAASRILRSKNKRVAVITNDQGDQQVDYAYIESLGIPGKEVSNGCFCCNFNQLDQHLQLLTRTTAPEYIFAEAVGSCTDMLATVVRPLKSFNPDLSILLCVFVDAELLTAITENRASFISDSVRYIYKKQIEEADVLIVSKADTMTSGQLAQLNSMLSVEYANKCVLFQNSLDPDSMRPWIDLMEKYHSTSQDYQLDIDYQRYGQGEAELAWVDKSLIITSAQYDVPFIVRVFIGIIFDRLQQEQMVIGHLKFFIESKDGSQKISFTTTSTSSSVTVSLPGTNRVSLMINARVQTIPERLIPIVDEALRSIVARFGCNIEERHTAAFVPGFPKPTYRMT